MANELNYVNFDFATIVTQLQNRVKDNAVWQDIYRSGTGEMFLEVMAYILNMGLYYTERRAQESYLPTARLRSSLVNLVSLIGYSPKRKTSSEGNLQFTIPSPLTKIVYISKYTECQSADGYKFLTNASAAIEKGSTSVTVEAVQGSLVTMEITSDGSENQEYNLNETTVEDSADTSNPTLRVVIDGEVWTLVSSFIDSDSASKHYRIINEMDGTVTVRFGDDINGKSPDSGSTITITYVKSDGLAGNVANTGQITTINDTVYDEDGDAITDISVTNTSSFLGGDDEESIEEIRAEAPQVFKTGDRAVTRSDFVSIIQNYSGVATVNVWGENEEAEAAGVAAVQSMLNKVKISVVLQEWEIPDDTFKSNLSDFIYDQSMLTVKYEFVDPTILDVVPVLKVKVNTGYSLSQTQADIETVLANQFLLGSTTDIGTTIRYSEVLSAIHSLDGVAYANMTLEVRQELSDTYNSVNDWGVTLNADPIKPESIRLYIDNVEVTSDTDNGDGTGSFSSAGGYTISGDINYTTGVMTLDISPSASAVMVRYQQDEDGNLVPDLREICKLYDVDIDSIAIVS